MYGHPGIRQLGLGIAGAAVVFVGTAGVRGAGVAVLGDSLSDEYAFPIYFPEGGNRQAGHAANYVELLSALRPASFDFGAYSTSSRGTPRNQGFAFNFARDGSTSAELLAEGQHTGAAGEISGGRVQFVLMEIGGNDYRGVFAPGADPASITFDALSNTLTAVSALTADPRARVAVANVPDITQLPEARFAALRDPSLVPLLAQVSGLIEQYNGALAAQLAALPGGERVAVVDLNGIFDGIINDPALTIDGHPVDTLLPGDGPGHLFVDVIHPGTVGSGFVANGFIDALNGRFGTSIDRLSEREIYAAAITPEPAGVSLVLVPASLLMLRRRRKGGSTPGGRVFDGRP